ncbi:MAG TPA: hypothetical protein VIF84_10860 [Candidatus Limnocylindrales bacterium]
MAVIFLDQDDEITTAIARLRGSQDHRIALVLPPGSRLGTSRINFRLLAREAQELPRQASVVTTEPGVRAIAVSAGLAAYASVAEYETAIAAPVAPADADGSTAGAAAAAATPSHVPPIAAAAAAAAVTAADAPPADAAATPDAPPTAAEPVVKATSRRKRKAAAAATAGVAAASALEVEGTPSPIVAPGAADASGAADGPAAEAIPAKPGPPAAPSDPDAETTVVPVAAAAAVAAGATAGSAGHTLGPRSSGALPVVGGPVRSTGALGGRGGLLGIVAVVGVLAVVLVATAVLVLPQATITVAPPLEAIGPVTRTVVADPTAIEPDIANGVIPAELVTIPLAAKGDFRSTGTKVTEKAARGTVTFSNLDPTGQMTIPKGAIVATDSNVRFRTLSSVKVPKGKFRGFTVDPGQASVRVEAVKAGPAGNVPANAIQNVPSGTNPVLLKVTNGDETSGGVRTESPRVSQEDVDLAVAELTKALDQQMTAALGDPATVPQGTSLIPETARTGKVAAEPSLAGLVGRNARTFELALSSTGQVVAVDTGVLEPLAAEALASEVPQGAELFPESVSTTIGSPTVDGGVVSFEIGASGQAWRPPDIEQLLTLVRGRSVFEAEDALGAFGAVEIETWPFYVATIPDGDRTTVTVVPPTPSGP